MTEEQKGIIDKISEIANDYVLFAKCAKGDAVGEDGVDREVGGILLDGCYYDNTNFVELIAIGPACSLFEADMTRWGREDGFGDTTWCPEWTQDMFHIEGEYWMIRERELLPSLIRDDGTIVPLADIVVVEMDTSDMPNVGDIHIADVAQRIGKNGKVLAAGPKCVYTKTGIDVCLPEEFRIFEKDGKVYGVLKDEEVLGEFVS